MSAAKAEEQPDISIFTSSSVYSSSSEKISVSTFFKPNSTVVISFIRHFNCGSCQEYVKALGKQVEEFNNLNANVMIIGQGEAKRISAYKDRTKCPYDVYADPDRQLYEKLGLGQMQISDFKDQPSYSSKSAWEDAIQAIQARGYWAMGSWTGGGNFFQNGGEYIFRTDEQGRTHCAFARKMPGSRNHTPPDELLEEVRRAGPT